MELSQERQAGVQLDPETIEVTEEMVLSGLRVLYRAEGNDVLAVDYLPEVFREMLLNSCQFAP